ncbi:MAG TPA: AEC family transporter [Candidatus Absconditabacterales bacterium]|nr:AEC family transporter [Candidatus Absconditabacterales bacterium]HMT26787.1 AEC family transporter [Candidatus Absconditabacterales bacterium]
MNLFFDMFAIFFLIFLGFLGGRFFGITERSLTRLLFYIIIPVVICKSVMNASLGSEGFILPFLFFILACSISLFSYFLSGYFFDDATRKLIGFASGQGNYLFFGMSLALLFVGSDAVTIVVAIGLGFAFFENTLGMYLASSTKHSLSLKNGLKNILKLPVLYASIFGLLLRAFDFQLSGLFLTVGNYFTGAVVIIGMLLVGISFAHVDRSDFDFKFVAYMLSVKFLIWPLFIVFLIVLDQYFFHLFYENIYRVFFIIAMKPLGVNSIVIAQHRNLDYHKMAVAVFSSTLLAFFLSPLVYMLFDYLHFFG